MHAQNSSTFGIRPDRGPIIHSEAVDYYAALLLILSLTVRLALLGGPLDVPDWRQADTAYMAYRMWLENPPEILHPKTPFRGPEDVKAAEFPIYPLVVALVWKLLGSDSLVAARVVTLLFFLGSLAYLYATMRVISGTRTALLAVAVYSILPLGIPYSRMIHPDFCIVFFCHMYLYHAVMLVRRRRLIDYLLAACAAGSFFVMKAPYGFYMVLPAAALLLVEWPRRRLTGLLLLGSVFILPLVLAWWFNTWRINLEKGHAESLIYPMKWTAESLRSRFFGSLGQRLDMGRWEWLIKRTVILVTTVPGVFLILLGAIGYVVFRDLRRAGLLFWTIAAGVLVYVLLVFPMVSSDHDYYSLPFLFPAAVGAALGIEAILRLPLAQRWVKQAAAIVALLSLVLGAAYGLRRGPFLYGPPYFTHDWQRIEAGRAIAEETAPTDLVLSVTAGRSTGWSDPRILYYARRRGWAREGRYLTEDDLRRYCDAGATVAALLLASGYDPSAKNFGVLASYPYRVRRLIGPGGEEIGHLVIFDLRKYGGS